MSVSDSGQAGATIEITKEAFEAAYNLWRSGLEDVEFPNPPSAPWSADSLFRILLFQDNAETRHLNLL